MSISVNASTESDNIMRENEEQQNESQTETIGDTIMNDEDQLIGYQCAQVLNTNTVKDVDLVFYIDLAYPAGEEAAAIAYIQRGLVEQVSSRYGISSGVTCNEPPLDGTSWVVKFVSKPSDYSRVDLFDSCRELKPEDAQDCFVYEAKVTGWVEVGYNGIPDVMRFVEFLLDGQKLTSESEGKYAVGFLGAPKEATATEGQGDSGRDNLTPPSSIQTVKENPSGDDDRQTVTIVGGLLVAAFCCAFMGIVLIMWRRRRVYLQSQDMHLTLSKSDLQQYDTEPHDSDILEENNVNITSYNHVNQSPLAAAQPQREALDEDIEIFPNNITFDLGTSFKDQLMGLHGIGGVSQRRPPVPFGSDASESDADSWAQTDGTIGSLELQLEPITAEV